VDKYQIPVLGIDLGGTKIFAGMVKNHRVIGERKRVPTPKGAENIIEALIGLIEEFQAEHQAIIGVGIATAGIVNPETGEVIGSTGNLPGWEGTEVKKLIEARVAVPVHVENDANAAAYGEYKALKLDDSACVMAVTLGTGIGGGIVINGRMYRGDHYAAGEVGHIKISMDNKRQCTCGLWDCWEEYGSGRGLVKTSKELLDSSKPGESKLYDQREKLKTEDVINGARDGDPIASKALHLYHEHISVGVASLCNTLDPNVVVVTGGMSKFVDFDLLHQLVAERTLPRVRENLKMHRSVLGEAAGLVGAADLVLDIGPHTESIHV
jgi:glucokinase